MTSDARERRGAGTRASLCSARPYQPFTFRLVPSPRAFSRLFVLFLNPLSHLEKSHPPLLKTSSAPEDKGLLWASPWPHRPGLSPCAVPTMLVSVTGTRSRLPPSPGPAPGSRVACGRHVPVLGAGMLLRSSRCALGRARPLGVCHVPLVSSELAVGELFSTLVITAGGRGAGLSWLSGAPSDHLSPDTS